jgi:hypothetical protein
LWLLVLAFHSVCTHVYIFVLLEFIQLHLFKLLPALELLLLLKREFFLLSSQGF